MRIDIDGVPGVTQIGWDLTVLGVAFVQTCGTVCSAPAESLVAPLGRIADEFSALFTVQYRRPSGDDRHARTIGNRSGAGSRSTSHPSCDFVRRHLGTASALDLGDHFLALFQRAHGDRRT